MCDVALILACFAAAGVCSSRRMVSLRLSVFSGSRREWQATRIHCIL